MSTTQSALTNAWPKPASLNISRWRIEIPSRKDPRYVIWGCQLLFFILGVEFLNFTKDFSSLATCILVGGLLDMSCMYLLHRKLIFPQSGLVTSTGVALVLDSGNLWVYALAVAVGLLSKYIFVVNRKHYFNPNAIGVIFALSFFPTRALSFPPQWTGAPWVWFLILALGLFTVIYARVLSVALSWVLGYFLFSFLKVIFLGAAAPLIYAIPSGAGFALFTFFMITDPKTMPISFSGRIGFALAVAFFDAWVRQMSQPNSLYIGIFITQYLLFVWAVARTTISRERGQP